MLTTNEIVRLAGEAGCSPATVRDFVRRKRHPHPLTLKAINAAAARLKIALPEGT